MRHLDRVLGIAISVIGGLTLGGCQLPPATGRGDGSQMAVTSLAAAPDPTETLAQSGSIAPALVGSGFDAAPAKVVAPYHPPPGRAEIPPTAPSPQALWERGHWHWTGAQYVWSPGRYIERPQPDANWIPGYWEQEADGWVWVEGRWT